MTPSPKIDDSTTLATDYADDRETIVGPTVRRKMHVSVNISMTPSQVDYLDEKRGGKNGTKTSVWIRQLIHSVYPDFPDMEEEDETGAN
jgi:hypothetical protein